MMIVSGPVQIFIYWFNSPAWNFLRMIFFGTNLLNYLLIWMNRRENFLKERICSTSFQNFQSKILSNFPQNCLFLFLFKELRKKPRKFILNIDKNNFSSNFSFEIEKISLGSCWLAGISSNISFFLKLSKFSWLKNLSISKITESKNNIKNWLEAELNKNPKEISSSIPQSRNFKFKRKWLKLFREVRFI